MASRKSAALNKNASKFAQMENKELGSKKGKSSRQEFEDAKKRLEDHMSGFSFDPDYITRQTIEFGKFLTQIPLYDYQYKSAYRIIHAVLTISGDIITMLFSRQSGKTETVAFSVDTLAVLAPTFAGLFPELEQYKDGIKMGLFAPQQEQVSTTYSRCLSRLNTDTAAMILEDPEIEASLRSETKLHLDNGSFLKGQVAAKGSKIESKTYDLVIIEEGQDVESFIAQKSIEPMVSATNGTIIKVGTTGTQKNHFWFDIQENKRLSRKLPPELALHYEFDYKAVIASKRRQFEIDGKAFHLNYEKDVMKKKSRWGEDSDAFRLGFALVWALDSGMFITDPDWERITNKKRKLATEISEDDFIVAGLDIGKEQNSTVLTIGKSWLRDEMDDQRTKEVINWLEMLGEDYDSQHYMICDWLIEYNVRVLYADYTGVGKPVVDRLIAELGEFIEIVPYTFTKASKSDMWLNLQGDIRAGRLIVPAHKTVQQTRPEFKRFEDQLKGLLKWYDGSYLCAQKGDQPEDRDDYCDSLGLMSLAGNVTVVEDAEDSEENVFFEDILASREARRNASY